LQLLDSIGAVKHDKKNDHIYQDSVTAPVDRSFDDDAVGQEEEDDNDESSDVLQNVLSAIEKASARFQI
jgi:hypothetical protein